MQVLSVNVTEPKTIAIRGKQVETSIYKHSVDQPIQVDHMGFDGERRISERMCEAEDHAVYIYPHEHYASWCEELDVASLPYGQFGENLTTTGLLEGEVRIGDVLRCGGITLRVRQPRLPCKKLDVRMERRFAGSFLRSRRLGFYLSVLEPGQVRAGDPIEVLERDETAPTVDELTRLTQIDYWDAVGLQALLECKQLPQAWRRDLRGKLQRAQTTEGWHGLRALEVVGREDTCLDHVSLWLRCAQRRPLPSFLPGQYLTMAYRTQDDRLLRRPYVITSHPSELGRYRITVHRTRPAGIVSSLLHDGVAIGDHLRMAAPRGEFTLRFVSERDRGLLFVHDEIGATSILPLLREWSERLSALPAHHLAVARPERLPLRQELERAGEHGARSQVLRREPREGWPAPEHPDGAAAELLHLAAGVSHVYVAGESGFVERVTALLSGSGPIVRHERFGRFALQ